MGLIGGSLGGGVDGSKPFANDGGGEIIDVAGGHDPQERGGIGFARGGGGNAVGDTSTFMMGITPREPALKAHGLESPGLGTR